MKEDFHSIILEDELLEMATIGKLANNETVKVHGDARNERQDSPHIHIEWTEKYKGKNVRYNLEVSISDLLCKDKLIILSLRRNNTRIITSETEDWSNYTSLHNDLKDFLFSKSNYYINDKKLKDKLSEAIWNWNKERDYSKAEHGINVMRLFMQEKNLKVLEKYNTYMEDIR